MHEADIKRLGIKRPRSKKPLLIASVSGGTFALFSLGFLAGSIVFRRAARPSRTVRLRRRLRLA